MKERPILFSAPMVRALLDGTKTQTRRLCKPMNAWIEQECREVRMVDGKALHFLKGATEPMETLHCPYGKAGDQLWVRETHAVIWPGEYAPENDADNTIQYRADTNGDCLPGDWPAGSSGCDVPKWIPSIHMKRARSRIQLEIVSVRVERLNDCSEADAKAEGVEPATCVHEYYDGYAKLWNDINGDGSWESNPWVWVIEFRRIAP